MASSAVVEGRGLHTGQTGAVRFEVLARRDAPVVLRAGAREVPIAALKVVDTTRSTTVADASGSLRFATIEHVLAALGGLGIHAGVAVAIEGPEAPLADGGARAYVEALLSLGLGEPRSVPAGSAAAGSAAAGSAGAASAGAVTAAGGGPLRVVMDGVIEVGASRYELRVAETISLEVVVDYEDGRIGREARWDGDARDFRDRIAVARTYGFEHEVADLLARGLASHVTPESVVVIGATRILASGAPFTADEPARHKLLDLVGDLYLYGGPPRGSLRALRPGHAATHAMMRRALDEGLMARAGHERAIHR